MAAQQPRQFRRQLHRGWRHRLEEAVVVGQFKHLIIGGFGQFGAAIANIHAPQPGHAIEQAHPVAIDDIAAFTPHDDAAAAHILHRLPILLRGQVMGDIQPLEFGDVVIAGHGVVSGCWPRRARPRT